MDVLYVETTTSMQHVTNDFVKRSLASKVVKLTSFLSPAIRSSSSFKMRFKK